MQTKKSMLNVKTEGIILWKTELEFENYGVMNPAVPYNWNYGIENHLFSSVLTLENGVVSKYIFPTGTALFGDDLYIYYGRDDLCVWVSSVKLSDLLTELKNGKHGSP